MAEITPWGYGHTPMFSKNYCKWLFRCHIVNITTFFLDFSFCLFFAWVCLPNLFGMILEAFPFTFRTSQAPLTRSVPLGSCGYREAITPRDQECWWVAGTSRPIPQAKSGKAVNGEFEKSLKLWSRDIGWFFPVINGNVLEQEHPLTAVYGKSGKVETSRWCQFFSWFPMVEL